MTYLLSDPHGEYDLFCRLLEKLRFSAEDTLYICGDLIDKGPQSVELCRLIFSLPNAHAVLGNHEYAFLRHYHYLMEDSPDDFEEVLARLADRFPPGATPPDWDLVDALESLPLYIEAEDFLCVHAGVAISEDGTIVPPADTAPEVLVQDRRFRRPEVRHRSRPCVFFGHTQTDLICGTPAILAYPRPDGRIPRTLTDYDKIHLDTGAWKTGVMGTFCLETLTATYVRR